MKVYLFFTLIILLISVYPASSLPLDASDYFSVEFTSVRHFPPHPDRPPDEVVEGDTIEYKVEILNRFTAVTQRNVRIQLTFPNMWVDPPEIPRRYVRWHNGGVVGDLPHILTPSTNYATWVFDSLPYLSVRTIVCTLIVLNVCGATLNDIALVAFVQAWSTESDPTKTADLSPPLMIRCRPGLVCNTSINKIGYSVGPQISIGRFDPMRITLIGSNFPYHDVTADSCLFYILVPPASIVTFDSASPIPYSLITLSSGPYNGWRAIVWMKDLQKDSSKTVYAYITDASGMVDSCYEAYAGINWAADGSRLWLPSGDPVPGFLDSSFVCRTLLGWCISSPDLTIAMDYPFNGNCISCGWPIYYNWEVRNIGSGIANADTLKIYFTVNGNPIDSTKIVNFSLDRNNSIFGRLPLSLTNCGDTIYICGYVDWDNRIEESNETNNTDCDSICVGISNINVTIFNVACCEGCDSVTDRGGRVVRASCDSPLAYISVTDQNNYPIKGLASSFWSRPNNALWTDFSIREDGIWNNLYTRNPIEILASDEIILPISVILCMDYSGSMSPTTISLAERSALNFVTSGLCAERFAVIKFDHNVSVLCDFTDDMVTIRNAIMSPFGGGATNILGALYSGLDLVMDDLTGRRYIIILFSDGGENVDQFTPRQIIDRANIMRVPIFTLGLGPLVDEPFLLNIARSTGGLYSYITSPEDLEQYYLFFCNYASYNYILHFRSRWDGGIDTLRVGLRLDNDSTFNIPLSGMDTSEFRTCSPICDIAVYKRSLSLPVDTIFGLPFVDTSNTYTYRIDVTNLGNGICTCNPVRIVDYLPDVGVGNVISITPSPTLISNDSIVWEVNPNNIVYGHYLTFTLSYRTTNDYEMLHSNYFILNSIYAKCGDDADTTNNIAIDTVIPIVTFLPPTIVCGFLNVNRNFPGDTAIITMSCLLPTPGRDWEAWLTGSCISGNLPLIPSTAELNRYGIVDTFVLNQLADGCDFGNIWAHIRVRQQARDSILIFEDSCLIRIDRPPCRSRIDRNTIKPGDKVRIEISQCKENDVKVRIINIAGEIVAELYDANLRQGIHYLEWDGKDKSGSPVSSGVYGIVVQAGNNLSTFKIAVVR